MKKFPILTVLIFFFMFNVKAQMGVAFSFFFPKDGEFSIPISPFSYRGVAFPFNNYTGIQTGATIYRMGGLSIVDFEFESPKSEFGPNITGYIPLELYLKMGKKSETISLKAGVFGFYGVFNKLNYGNIDRAIRDSMGWEVANADFSFKNLPGWGYQGGIEWMHQVNRKFALTFEVNYLYGGAKLNLEGSYIGGTGSAMETLQLNSPDARLDFTGLEITIGGVM